ncbi:hypothetical protein CHS0354_024364 [Potamilus streckersoni]|uniref:Uncharacterized protein n=1 Tax=Potamilus streckersoni TaxID=2493646 RepID=A0AAE0SUU5_9BIVA|nr:hypothetical protein CHS0354_024364 [Potamilus streckersoni]
MDWVCGSAGRGCFFTHVRVCGGLRDSRARWLTVASGLTPWGVDRVAVWPAHGYSQQASVLVNYADICGYVVVPVGGLVAHGLFVRYHM